jgi:hypothetical protein
MLPGNNVIDLERSWIVGLRHQAVFASVAGALANLQDQVFIHE